jgi:hypothetical protein
MSWPRRDNPGSLYTAIIHAGCTSTAAVIPGLAKPIHEGYPAPPPGRSLLNDISYVVLNVWKWSRLRHADYVEQCPSSRAKRKTYARTEFFSVWTLNGHSGRHLFGFRKGSGVANFFPCAAGCCPYLTPSVLSRICECPVSLFTGLAFSPVLAQAPVPSPPGPWHLSVMRTPRCAPA